MEINETVIRSYQQRVDDLLEANWNLVQDKRELKHQIEEAEKTIDCQLKELETIKEFFIQYKHDYDCLYKEFISMCNHAKTLEAVMPKEREINENNNR